ncbi:MAG: ABC-2 transporter permease [Cellulosilyticaceae bacterium]
MDNLYKLIRKELIFFKGTMSMQFIISLLFITVFPLISANFIFMGSMIIPYFAIYGAMAYEEKSRGEVLVAILPVSRQEICLSKYILGMLYTILGVVISVSCLLLGELFLPPQAVRTLVISNIGGFSVMMVVIGMIYTAIMLPIVFKFGTEKSRYIMLFLYMGIFAVSGVVGGVLKEIGKVEMGTGIAIGMGLVGILLYGLSINLSIKIMINKEF